MTREESISFIRNFREQLESTSVEELAKSLSDKKRSGEMMAKLDVLGIMLEVAGQNVKDKISPEEGAVLNALSADLKDAVHTLDTLVSP